MKKKFVSLMLSAAMIASLTGCGGKENPSDDQNTPTPTSGEASPTTTGDQAPSPTNGEEQEDENTQSGEYTFNDYAGGSPATWNPHEWETNDDAYIIDYTQMGLYSFYLNEAKNGYTVQPEMAESEPVDVTKEYAGSEIYGVPADADKGYAFRIKLNQNACWEDGTKITSEDYIYSAKMLLDPGMANYRASNFLTGQIALANANEYYNSSKAGQTKYSSLESKGYSSIEEAKTAGVEKFYIDMQGFYNVTDENGNGIFSIDDETKLRDEGVEEGQEGDYVSPKEVYEGYLAAGQSNEGDQAQAIFVEDGVYEATPWENVGIKADDEYTITLILTKPITEFYLYYNLASNWIVKKDIYEANMKKTGDITKTTYATSVDTYMSYGPYKLSEYQVDKQITMEKNDKWYGYTDGKHEGKYQTTRISCQIIPKQETALQLFLKGEIDGVSLTAENMDTYRTSDYIIYTPQSYTSKLTFNSDKTALEKNQKAAGSGINMTMLSYQDFRQAIALSIDRTKFTEQCTATHKPGYGLLNYMYVYDPDNGSLYRETEEAKQALCNVYGVSDESEITGYDKTKAAELFTKAYNDAVAAKDYKDGDTVQINFHLYASDDGYKKIFNFIQDAVSEAAVGTPFEGKIKFEFIEDPDYYNSAKNGNIGVILTTWGGSSMDPWGTTWCYGDPNTCQEYGLDVVNTPVTIKVDGKEVSKSFYDWYLALTEGEYVLADNKTKLQVLAGFEEAYLQTYATTPLYYRTSASLLSRKINYATDEYVQIVGFGGIPEITYNYDDAQWEAYLKENNNQLSY